MRGIALFVGLAAGAAARAGSAPAAAPVVLSPDGDGILDLAAAQAAAEAEPLPNPFRVRYRPAPPVREVALALRSVAVPEGPEGAAALINGRVYSAGDPLEGLTLTRIGAEGVELARGGFVARVPVQDRPVRLRLRP